MARERPPRDDADRAALEAAMEGVRPLADRGKLRAPAAPPRRGVADRGEEGPTRFEVERRGERVQGRAPGIDCRWLRRLAAGAIPVEVRVDLHGLDVSAARRTLRETIARAAAEGARCVLVVHGRGRHSEQGAVLREALPEWLAEAPVGRRVMAFASAAGRHGGAGATYVLLRRPR